MDKHQMLPPGLLIARSAWPFQTVETSIADPPAQLDDFTLVNAGARTLPVIIKTLRQVQVGPTIQ